MKCPDGDNKRIVIFQKGIAGSNSSTYLDKTPNSKKFSLTSNQGSTKDLKAKQSLTGRNSSSKRAKSKKIKPGSPDSMKERSREEKKLR